MHSASGLTIEVADMGALEAVRALNRSVMGTDERDEYLAEAVRSSRCALARLDGRPAGFAVIEQSFYGYGFIALLIVHPELRRQGVATGLVQHAESASPTEKLFTSTNQSNAPMQRLMDALGFERSGTIHNLDEGDPEIVYFKRVAREAGGTTCSA